MKRAFEDTDDKKSYPMLPTCDLEHFANSIMIVDRVPAGKSNVDKSSHSKGQTSKGMSSKRSSDPQIKSVDNLARTLQRQNVCVKAQIDALKGSELSAQETEDLKKALGRLRSTLASMIKVSSMTPASSYYTHCSLIFPILPSSQSGQ